MVDLLETLDVIPADVEVHVVDYPIAGKQEGVGLAESLLLACRLILHAQLDLLHFLHGKSFGIATASSFRLLA